jgi:hypothetical protein
VIRLSPGFQFSLDITATLAATGRRTQFVATSLAVGAASTPAASRLAPTSTTLAVTAATTADSRVTRFASASLAVTATRAAAVSRITFASSTLALTADSIPDSLRATFVTSSTAVTASANGLLQLQAPLQSNTTVTANTAPASYVNHVGSAELDLLATFDLQNIARFLTAANLRVVADPEAKGGLLLSATAELNTTATADIDLIRDARIDALLNTLATVELGNVQFIHAAQVTLALLATAPATMLYRRSGGNPMWLTFFYAGQGERTL